MLKGVTKDQKTDVFVKIKCTFLLRTMAHASSKKQPLIIWAYLSTRIVKKAIKTSTTDGNYQAMPEKPLFGATLAPSPPCPLFVPHYAIFNKDISLLSEVQLNILFKSSNISTCVRHWRLSGVLTEQKECLHEVMSYFK